MSDTSRARLGIVNGICVFLIVLGILAGISIFKIYTTKNASYGEPQISHIENKDDFYISENEELFFEYSGSMPLFDKQDDGYVMQVLVEPLEIQQDKTYRLYLNNIYVALRQHSVGLLSAFSVFNFTHPDGTAKLVDVMIDLTTYNDRSVLSLRLNTLDDVGYINQMTKSGMNIKIVEAEIVPPATFEVVERNDIDGADVSGLCAPLSNWHKYTSTGDAYYLPEKQGDQVYSKIASFDNLLKEYIGYNVYATFDVNGTSKEFLLNITAYDGTQYTSTFSFNNGYGYFIVGENGITSLRLVNVDENMQFAFKRFSTEQSQEIYLFDSAFEGYSGFESTLDEEGNRVYTKKISDANLLPRDHRAVIKYQLDGTNYEEVVIAPIYSREFQVDYAHGSVTMSFRVDPTGTYLIVKTSAGLPSLKITSIK